MKCLLQLPLPKPKFQGGAAGAAKIFRAGSDPACIHPTALLWARVWPPWEAPGAQQLPVTSFHKNAFEKCCLALGSAKERWPPPAQGRAALPSLPAHPGFHSAAGAPRMLVQRAKGALGGGADGLQPVFRAWRCSCGNFHPSARALTRWKGIRRERSRPLQPGEVALQRGSSSKTSPAPAREGRRQLGRDP